MKRQIIVGAIAIVLCLSVSQTDAQQRGKGGEPGRSSTERKPEGAGAKQPTGSTAPGGDWSARRHSGKVSGTSAAQKAAPDTSAAAAGAAERNKTPQPTGAQGAAAATAVNRNQAPQATGAQGAAMGAA